MPHEYVALWQQAHADLREVATTAPWDQQSLLPGWTVADIAAHTIWIERTALGRVDPPHEPNWSGLPHARGDFGRASEVPVDLRRTRPRAAVLAEWDDTVADRLAVLAGTPAQERTQDIFGAQRPVGDVLRTRIFDLWVHEQDIRVPAGMPGNLDSSSARLAAEVLIGGLGMVWARRAGAPVGSSLVVATTGPGISLTAAVATQADGRARPVAPDATAEPTVRLTTGFGNLVALMCGRSNADPGGVRMDGDAALAERVIAALAVTP